MPRPPKAPPLIPPQTEAQFQNFIIKLATTWGFLIYHTHDSRRSVAGFPDLVMVRGKRVIYAELKATGKYPAPAQRAWLAALKAAGQEVYLWRPDQKAEVIDILRPD